MGLTVGKYLLDRFRPNMIERLVDISDLVVEKALIPHSAGPQLVRTSATASWDNNTAECKFYSVDVSVPGQLTCGVVLTDTGKRQNHTGARLVHHSIHG